MVYFGVVKSHGIDVWVGAVPSKYRLLIAQKIILPSTFGMNVWKSCVPIFKKFNILTVYSFYDVYKLFFFLTYCNKF